MGKILASFPNISQAQMNTFTSLVFPLITFDTVSDTTVSNITDYIPRYIEDGHQYKKGDPFVYNGRYFRASQDITTSSVWHPGDVGTESLFYEIRIAPDGIIVWSQPFGEYNAPDKGDLRHYPDPDSPIYRSLIGNNAYSPDEYPDGWELYEA